MLRTRLLPIAALLLLAGCGAQRPDTPAVDDAWVRLPAVAGRPAAAYFTVTGGKTPDRLVAVESPRAARIELHEGGMHDGMMTMREIAGIDVPAGGTVAFAPHGDHAMLFGVDPTVKPGATLPLAFRFRSGATIEAQAKTIAAGDPAPAN